MEKLLYGGELSDSIFWVYLSASLAQEESAICVAFSSPNIEEKQRGE